ncbi:hypothetical protein BD410DRAFT_830633 [Rickenella mellea]|uniref:DUF6533 domain-containing protein n=1 Tax=Rickenella mellea TaxID=50990 RepID=A0A4Y7PU21_9AGAM|nr:hypothetical protein BD410DRAFT_830633 [Rickenella mellea]
MDPADLQALTISLQHLRVVNYVNVTTVVLVAYDYFLTFGDEVRLIWGTKWGFGKICYFLARYTVCIDVPLNILLYLVPNLNPAFCAPINKVASWICYIGILASEIILMMRVYAMYGGSRKMTIFLVVLCSALNIPNIILLETTLKSLVFLSPPPFPAIAPCVTAKSNRIFFIDLFLLMFSELVVLILTVWRGVYQWREHQSPLIKTLVKDGIFYFLCLFTISSANAVVLISATVEYSAILLWPQRVLHALLASRIMLHIRDTAYDPPTQMFLSWAAPAGRSKALNVEFSSSPALVTERIGMSVVQRNSPLDASSPV